MIPAESLGATAAPRSRKGETSLTLGIVPLKCSTDHEYIARCYFGWSGHSLLGVDFFKVQFMVLGQHAALSFA